MSKRDRALGSATLQAFALLPLGEEPHLEAGSSYELRSAALTSFQFLPDAICARDLKEDCAILLGISIPVPRTEPK